MTKNRIANDAGELAVSVIKLGAKKAAVKGIQETGKMIGKKVGSTALRKFAGSNAGTAVAMGIVDLGCNVVQLACGEISGKEFARNTASSVGGAAGTYGGTLGGAAIGSAICPVIGTAIGALIGGIGGGFGGSSLMEGICGLFD